MPSIVEKLKLQKYTEVTLLQIPNGSTYFEELSVYDTKLIDTKSYDLIFAFVLDMESLQSIVHEILAGNYVKRKVISI